MADEAERLQSTIVPPDGPLDSKVLFLGEAPGKEEDGLGRPFIGDAGQLLNRCLRSVGTARSEILISNVFSQRPPENNINYYFQDRSNKIPTWEGQEHINVLQQWLEGLLKTRRETGKGPNVIAALGAVPMRILTGKSRITKWRGSVLPCTLVPGFKVYPTFHPSYVNRLLNEPRERLLGEKKKDAQNVLPLFVKDLERIMEQGESPDFVEPKRTFLINPSLEEIVTFLRGLHSRPYVAVDIETLGSDNGPILWCIGFAGSPSEAMCIPIIKEQKLYWSPKEEARIWREVSELFLNPSVVKVFHNGMYDLSILGRYYGLRVAPGSFGDTMIAFQAVYPYLRKGLHVLTSIFTWEPYYKDDGKVWEGKRISDTSEFVYNCRDCCVTTEIYPQITRDAREKGMWNNYRTSLDVAPSLLRMQIRGVRIDVEKKDRLGEEFRAKAQASQETLNSLADKYVNIGSPTQLLKLLYGAFEMEIQYHHKTRKPTTDKDAINRLLKKYPKGSDKHRVLKAISNFRKFDKLSSTYANMEVDIDGRIHTSYFWVSTFRLNSKESHFGGGGNLQNIPVRTDEGRMVRKLFIPDEGMVLLGCDLAQAEAREVAWLAGDIRLIEAFESEESDVHWERAKEIFQLPSDLPYVPQEKATCNFIDEPHKMKFFRDIGKTIVHAFNYRMGPRMLQNILIRQEVHLDFSICKQFLNQAKIANPLTVQWQKKTEEEVRATRMLTTALGDTREFRGRLNDDLFRSAIAFRPQSVVGRILQLGTQAIHSSQSYYEPLLNVHDEVIGQCREEDVPRSMKLIRECLEIPHKVGDRVLTIPTDFKLSRKSWGDMQEINYSDYVKE